MKNTKQAGNIHLATTTVLTIEEHAGKNKYQGQLSAQLDTSYEQLPTIAFVQGWTFALAQSKPQTVMDLIVKFVLKTSSSTHSDQLQGLITKSGEIYLTTNEKHKISMGQRIFQYSAVIFWVYLLMEKVLNCEADGITLTSKVPACGGIKIVYEHIYSDYLCDDC